VELEDVLLCLRDGEKIVEDFALTKAQAECFKDSSFFVLLRDNQNLMVLENDGKSGPAIFTSSDIAFAALYDIHVKGGIAESHPSFQGYENVGSIPAKTIRNFFKSEKTGFSKVPDSLCHLQCLPKEGDCEILFFPTGFFQSHPWDRRSQDLIC
jgi:hypothetical protein